MNTPDDSAGADYTGPDHGFGDDNALADEILQQDWYADNPSAHDTSRMGARRWELPTTVDGLTPDMREPILKQLIGVKPEQRAHLETQLVRKAIEERSKDVRILTGLGDGATPLAKAQVNIAYRARELARRISATQSELDEVTGSKAVTDHSTGQTVMQPLYRLTGELRYKATEEVNRLKGELSVLNGPEGDKELEQALRESVDQVKDQRQAAADLVEIDRRARESIREDELNARAELHAKHLRAKSNYSASL